MKHKLLYTIVFTVSTFFVNAQTSINDLKNQTDLARLTTTVRELSGEDPTTVAGAPVTITHRVSNAGNDLAADYIKERLTALGLTITDQIYSTGGRNIIATQTGVTNPDDIYIVSAHYDSVANYCGDDNASGTAAVMEVARILSEHCTDNTIVYALWDEEETGLHGSRYYAQQAAANSDNILGVFNIDMMAYDNDNDNNFDIDLRNIAGSVAMKDQILSVLNDPAFGGFNLTVNVVNPGTSSSDHSSFWNEGYSAVLFGEAWSQNDKTSGYHTSNDRVGLFNWPYYHNMTKLVVAYMATVASPIFIDKTVVQNTTTITSNEVGATYQWVDCNNGDAPIAGATSQAFTPTVNGTYAVNITKGNCTKKSECVMFNVLGVEDFGMNSVNIYPNPTKDQITITGFDTTIEKYSFILTDINGKEILKGERTTQNSSIDLSTYASGVYFLNIKLSEKEGKVFQVIKD